MKYLETCLRVFNIFVKATTKLQAEKYPTIYYLLPEVYSIYTKLENIRDELNLVRTFFYILLYIYILTLYQEVFTIAINKGIAKLRKYYPKTGIDNKNKALYLALILDPRIKEGGLSQLGLSNGTIIDIKTKLKEEYNL